MGDKPKKKSFAQAAAENRQRRAEVKKALKQDGKNARIKHLTIALNEVADQNRWLSNLLTVWWGCELYGYENDDKKAIMERLEWLAEEDYIDRPEPPGIIKSPGGLILKP